MISEFLEGLAQHANDAALGVWDPERRWTGSDTDTAILMQKVPPFPDRLIVLAPYVVQDNPDVNDSIQGVQFRTRGPADDPRTVQDLNDAIFNVFHGLNTRAVNGVNLVSMWRVSGAPAVQDANDRWESTTNFYARIAWPTLYRTD